jgi:hypothetical protein
MPPFTNLMKRGMRMSMALMQMITIERGASCKQRDLSKGSEKPKGSCVKVAIMETYMGS